MKLWLDDVRPAPDGWTHAHSVNDAIKMVSAAKTNNNFKAASLDHDLGDFACDGGDASNFVKWMAETSSWPTEFIRIHTHNPVERDAMFSNIMATIRRFPDDFTDQFDVFTEPA